jgi:hypothetical protein
MTSLRKTLTLLVAAFMFCCEGHSQAKPTATGPGSYVAVGAGISGFETDYGKNDIGGALVYADVNPEWRVGLEGEARFLRIHSAEQVTETDYLGGIRVLLWPKPHRWEPYAKFLAGVGRITLPYGYAHGSFLAYAPGAGVNVALTRTLTWRVVDVEYQRWPQFTYGSLSPYGVSTGISLRLNPLSRFPKGARARR